jgi:2-polyprenyl-6-methoxyphenol hydroxylase-like FAD-dependent oxidoreductase
MPIGKQAVVIGAGMGGLTAARALVGMFERIVVLERDVLPAGIEPRAGVPQGRQPHALLPGGLAALDDLFDGYGAALHSAGAKIDDMGMRLIYEFPGQPAMPERRLGITLVKATRPLIEGTVRRFIGQHQEVVLLDGRRVTEIVATPDGSAVSAVRCETRDGTLETHEAELVIDASSRGELTLEFLRATGRAMPAETTIGVDFSYSTVLVDFPAGHAPRHQVHMNLPDAPASSRMGLLLAREDDYMFAALGGRGKDAPPADWPGFLACAAQLPGGALHATLEHARPHGKVLQYSFPESRRRHFERCENWPRGLMPFADAICRFNPVYGQGMTAAAQQAVLLRDLLDSRRRQAQPLAGLFEALMEQVTPLLDNIWALSALPDLAYPDARGERPDNLDEALQFNIALHRAAFLDADIHQRLFNVIALLKPASEIQSEAVVEKVQRLAQEFAAVHGQATAPA